MRYIPVFTSELAAQGCTVCMVIHKLSGVPSPFILHVINVLATTSCRLPCWWYCVKRRNMNVVLHRRKWAKFEFSLKPVVMSSNCTSSEQWTHNPKWQPKKYGSQHWRIKLWFFSYLNTSCSKICFIKPRAFKCYLMGLAKETKPWC